MTIDLVLRGEWGARRPEGQYTQLESTRGVKVHYTGGRVDPGIADSHTGCVALVRSIQGYHMDGNGWMDVGYTYLVCPHRKVFEGRGPHHLPAANGAGLNSAHYAVLGLVGTSGLVQPTDDLLLGIRDAIDYLRANGGAGNEIKGHRDGYNTDCPGEPLYAWVRRGAPRPGAKAADSPPAYPGRPLRYPPVTRGQDVRLWQEQMRRRGWKLSADGAYGPDSRDVCRRFQRETGVEDDGVVGPLTWRLTWESPLP